MTGKDEYIIVWVSKKRTGEICSDEPKVLCSTELNEEDIEKALRFWERARWHQRQGFIGRRNLVKAYAEEIKRHPEKRDEILRLAKKFLSRTSYWRLRKLLNLP